MSIYNNNNLDLTQTKQSPIKQNRYPNQQSFIIIPTHMEAIQISQSTLQAIFVDRDKFTPQIVKEIIKWNQELEPSVNLIHSMISAYLLPNLKLKAQEEQQQQSVQEPKDKINQATNEAESMLRLQKAVQDIPETLTLLQQHKCPKNFLRAYLLFIKKNLPKIHHLINKQYILSQWVTVGPQILENYCDAFSIYIQKYTFLQENRGQLTQQKDILLIKAQDFDQKIFELIDKKQFPFCMNLIKYSNCQKHHINKMLQKMTNNKQASKAADYVKSLKLNPADYPALGQRLYKNTARHFLSKNGWQYAQEIFETHPQGLACVIEDLIFKKKYDQAMSIWHRNESCRGHILKEESLEFIKKYFQTEIKNEKMAELKIKENFLHKDQFGPSDRQKYLSLQELGYKEEQVIWIDQNTKDLQIHLKQILNSQILGIDTESIVGQTKFDKSQHSKFEQAALIQIATRKAIYLIDGFRVKHMPLVRQTITKYIQNGGLIVGHTLDNDMDCLLKSLGFSDQQIKQLRQLKVIDIWKLFKAVYPKQRFSSLAFITQQLLGKQIDKQQTLTNWQRRPLRRNQKHYAAMDAAVVIKVYDKFVEEIGEQMVEYYCAMDGGEF